MLSHRIHWHFYNILFIILLSIVCLSTYNMNRHFCVFVCVLVCVPSVRANMRASERASVYEYTCVLVLVWVWMCLYKRFMVFSTVILLSVLIISFCKLSRNHSSMTEQNGNTDCSTVCVHVLHTQRQTNGRTDR